MTTLQNIHKPLWTERRFLIHSTGRGSVTRCPWSQISVFALIVTLFLPPVWAGNPVVLEGATVIDGTGHAPILDGVIIVADGIIDSVGTIGELKYPSDAVVRNVSGKYIIPGLIDMHAHLPVGPFVAEQVDALWRMRVGHDESDTQEFLRVLLAHGITTARSTAGLTSASIALKKTIARGGILGPTLFVAGNVIDLQPSYWIGDFVTEVQTEAEIREEVRRQASAGVDFVKLYMRLPETLVCAAVEEAHASGIEALGHLHATSWTAAATCGIDGLVHGIPASADLLPPNNRKHYNQFTDTRSFYKWPELVDLEGEEIKELVRTLVVKGVAIDPTLVVFEAVFWGDTPAYTAHPDLSLTPPTILESWKRSNHTSAWTPDDFALAKATWPNVLALTKKMYEEGVLILSGSDTPNPFVIPGVSLHRELELLVAAGIAETEVLKIATHNGALALGILDRTGTIEAGKQADFLLLEANPLEDIQHTRAISLIFKDGTAYKPKTLLSADKHDRSHQEWQID